ncbi:transposase [Streptomyces gibsoniae]|uniref:transposase n=1 Tax=Streptomyces gibsoniae TaxID=3075529 RepID=UPI00374E03E5
MEGPASLRQRARGPGQDAEIVNALHYQSRTGCQWDDLPHDLPPRGAVYHYVAKWRDDGTDRSSTTCCAGRSARARATSSGPGWWC